MLPELRPRGIGEILDAGVAIYRARFGPLMKVTLWIVLPLGVISTLVQLSAVPDDLTFSPSATTPGYAAEDFLVQIAATFLAFAIQVISTTFVTATAAGVATDAYLGRPDIARNSVRDTFRNGSKILGLALLVTVAAVVPYLLCTLPGLVLLALWSIAAPALILEHIGITASLKRSWKLVSTRFWHSLGVYLAVQLLSVVLAYGLTALFGLLVFPSNDSASALVLVTSIASTIAAVMTTPIIATAFVVLYFDLRIRSEGFDVQMLLNRLDHRSADATPASPAW